MQPVSGDDPEAASVRREALNQLRFLISELDPIKQEMLALRFAGRLTAAEIALVVGKSEPAVQKQISRTLHHLQERYRDP
jgi:RNA polymerase sigma factor (sigma-70 family)